MSVRRNGHRNSSSPWQNGMILKNICKFSHCRWCGEPSLKGENKNHMKHRQQTNKAGHFDFVFSHSIIQIFSESLLRLGTGLGDEYTSVSKSLKIPVLISSEGKTWYTVSNCRVHIYSVLYNHVKLSLSMDNFSDSTHLWSNEITVREIIYLHIYIYCLAYFMSQHPFL